jgi:hypothetical protein
MPLVDTLATARGAIKALSHSRPSALANVPVYQTP